MSSEQKAFAALNEVKPCAQTLREVEPVVKRFDHTMLVITLADRIGQPLLAQFAPELPLPCMCAL